MAFATAGCDSLLDVANNADVERDETRSPAFAEALANGSLAQVSAGWDGMLSLLVIASDEVTFSGNNAAWRAPDEGNLDTPANEALESQFPRFASAYWFAGDRDLGARQPRERECAAGSAHSGTGLSLRVDHLCAVADGMASYAPSDRLDPGPEIPSERMDSLYASRPTMPPGGYSRAPIRRSNATFSPPVPGPCTVPGCAA